MRAEMRFTLSRGGLGVLKHRREREWLYANGVRPSLETGATASVPLRIWSGLAYVPRNRLRSLAGVTPRRTFIRSVKWDCEEKPAASAI